MRGSLVIFALGNRDDGSPKDTARNCERTGEFVVNLVDVALAEMMVRTSAFLLYGVSEATRENVEVAASASLRHRSRTRASRIPKRRF